MKKIKIVISLLVVVALFVGVIALVKKRDYSYYLVMGDYISNNQVINEKEINSFTSLVGEYLKEEKVVNEVNSHYLKNNMTSKNLLEMIEKNSYKIDDSSLVDLIKKSKYITITLGINDIIKQIKYDTFKDELIYDKDVINKKIEIFKHNYHQIIEEINEINKNSKVLLVGCYNLYGNTEISELLNEAIREVSNEDNCYFVDVSDLLDKYMYQENELYLTNLGQEIISKKVIALIKEIEVL